MDFYTKIFINWLPMFILIGLWIYIMKRGQIGKQGSYLQQSIEEQKVMNGFLQRIADSLERIVEKSLRG